MKQKKIAINGFGRIGRNAFKVAFSKKDIEIVAINDLTDTKTLAYLLKHDSNYGEYKNKVTFDKDHIIVNSKKFKVYNQKDPKKLPWKKLKIDVVIESTGRFVDPKMAALHVKAGAKKVIISAPAKGDGAETTVLGVNSTELESIAKVHSNASCTTNCVAPVTQVLQDNFGVAKGMISTIHSYTANQALQDMPSSKLRRGRAAAVNIVPTTTGSDKATGLVIPELKGKFGGLAFRVPTPIVSLIDCTFLLDKDTSIEEVNKTFTKASKTKRYSGILGVSDEELVSSDYIGDSRSAIVDLSLTRVVDGNMVKVVAWYDNEWGFSNRLVELVQHVSKFI